jgi:enoyl-CoA hydratase
MNEVLAERRGRVLLITLDRAGKRSAIDTDVAHGLAGGVAELDDDPGLTVGALTGSSSGFWSGMDLKAFAKSGLPKGLDRFLR